MKNTDSWTSDDLVSLDPDHPGFHDAEYRARRNSIARQSLAYAGEGPVPDVEYTDEEQGVWRTVWQELDPLHAVFACAEYRECTRHLSLDRVTIPQLREVNERLVLAQGFRMHPVAGLIRAKHFLRYLGRSVFLSTQYIRHHSRPFYTPEPDIVHELIGHAASLADPRFAALSREFGDAANRCDDPVVMTHLERLYWFTLEFGVVDQGGPVAYGAGLLSSSGELARFAAEEELRPFDLAEIIEHDYDPTSYQSILYVADDLDSLSREMTAWLRRQGAA